MHIKSIHDVSNSFRHQPFQDLSDGHFRGALVDAPCNFFKGVCVFPINGMFLNVSEKEIFTIVLKVHVQKVKRQLHVQS